MVSDFDVGIEEMADAVDEELVRGRGNKGSGKVPRKVHKAEREKLKRDHLNDLFSDLCNALEPSQGNIGKACILGDATRVLRELLAQVETLRKENIALLTESRYIMEEKNEIRDENAVLEAEIAKLQSQLQERMQPEVAWTSSSGTSTCPSATEAVNRLSLSPMLDTRRPLMSSMASSTSHLVPPPLIASAVVQHDQIGGPAGRPLIIFPLHPDLQTRSNPSDGNGSETLEPPPSSTRSNVRRPHARYPTPSDSWPSRLLNQNVGIEEERRENCSSRDGISGDDIGKANSSSG